MKTPAFAAALLAALAAPAFAAPPDCRHVVFQPEDPPLSRPVTLADGAREETVRLTIPERKPLLPWESDVFQVCLAPTGVSVEPVSTAYDYEVSAETAGDGFVVLTPGAKRLLPPDPRGVQGTLGPDLTLRLNDHWAEYYPAGTIVLKVELRRQELFRPDETLAAREVSLPVAAAYIMELSAAVSRPGGAYYARYRVRRLGRKVSTEEETPALETQKVSYDPGAAPGI